jgi:hypothetical protein
MSTLKIAVQIHEHRCLVYSRYRMRRWPDECICPPFEGIIVEENNFVVGVSLFLLWCHCTIIVVYFV